MSYQSPIFLNKDDVIYITHDVDVTGNNTGATYDIVNKVYNISNDDNIIICIDSKKYKLLEYHFHIPAATYILFLRNFINIIIYIISIFLFINNLKLFIFYKMRLVYFFISFYNFNKHNE